MSITDIGNSYHTLKIASESYRYCGITLFYNSPTYFYLKLDVGLSVSPAI